MHNPAWTVTLAVAFAFSVSATSTLAQPTGGVNITEAFVDFGPPDSITIIGQNFDSGNNQVTLGNFGQLNVTNDNLPTQIVVDCPDVNNTPTCIDGDFRLTVSTGAGQNRTDQYDLTIGAAGLQGPPGAPGLACWDLDGDDMCDLAAPDEDIDDDGFCTVADCQGPQGEPGSSGIVSGFDSGWFAVGTNEDHSLSHGLGTTAVVASIWFSKNSSGTDRFYGPAPLSWREHNPERVSGVTIVEMDTSTVKLRTGDDFRIPTVTPAPDGHEILTSGFARVILIAIE